jgi:hypothetical protein
MREVDSTATRLEMDSAVRALIDARERHERRAATWPDDMAGQKAGAKRWAALCWGRLESGRCAIPAMLMIVNA